MPVVHVVVATVQDLSTLNGAELLNGAMLRYPPCSSLAGVLKSIDDLFQLVHFSAGNHFSCLVSNTPMRGLQLGEGPRSVLFVAGGSVVTTP